MKRRAVFSLAVVPLVVSLVFAFNGSALAQEKYMAGDVGWVMDDRPRAIVIAVKVGDVWTEIDILPAAQVLLAGKPGAGPFRDLDPGLLVSVIYKEVGPKKEATWVLLSRRPPPPPAEVFLDGAVGWVMDDRPRALVIAVRKGEVWTEVDILPAARVMDGDKPGAGDFRGLDPGKRVVVVYTEVAGKKSAKWVLLNPVPPPPPPAPRPAPGAAPAPAPAPAR